MRWLFLLLFLSFGSSLALAQELHSLSHCNPRQMRGGWVASVHHITWPPRPGMTSAQQLTELEHMVERLAEVKINAIYFQVRPEGDALYPSSLEPWSRFLTGTQGENPGFDPLQQLIDLAHPRHIEVHAWLNPYRARALPPDPQPSVLPHLAAILPQRVHSYGKLQWMDPAAPEVRQRLVAVCLDLAQRYDLDGIHFDDYFYPYPEGDRDFPDDSLWQDYQKSGGTLSRAEWRRFQVDLAVQQVSQALRQSNPYLRFGISPFGLPAPQRPAGIQGFDQFEKLYADPQHWIDRGWVDYLAPQLYWPSTRSAQAFVPLLQWWCQHLPRDGQLFAGIHLSAWGSHPQWTPEEYRFQFRQVAAQPGCSGYILWNINLLLQPEHPARRLMQEVHNQTVLTPALERPELPVPLPPVITTNQGKVEFTPADSLPLRALVLYRKVGPDWTRLILLRPLESPPPLEPGEYALAVVARDGGESLARTFSLP